MLLGYDRGTWSEHLRPTAMEPLGRDLAALCLATPAETEPLALGDRSPALGDRLTATGYGRPAIHRQQERSCTVLARDRLGDLRLDCPLSSGTSGGPLLQATPSGKTVVAIAVASNESQSLAIAAWSLDLDALCSSPER
ncbi:MAG: hypothetical protein Kilf2KO_11460 [Rhodospirillales bacterium]